MGALSGNAALSGLSGLHTNKLLTINNVITINWAGVSAAINRKVFGVNLYQPFSPAVANAQGYQDALDYLNPEMVRIHNAEQMFDSTLRSAGWVKNPTLATYSWDTAKITSVLSVLAPGRIKMLCVPGFPAAISNASKQLLPGKTTEYATFVVQLLTIAANCNAGITHVQLLNELDSAYSGASNMAVMGAIWNEVRDAIKAAFPSMLVLGHSFANVYNSTNVNAYLDICKLKMDGFTYNAYTTANPGGTTQQQMWNSAVNTMPSSGTTARNYLVNKGVLMPVYGTEQGMLILGAANPLAIGAKRMVWEALRMINTVTSNLSFVGAWNDSDGWHGLLDGPAAAYSKRPAAHIYHLFNGKILGSKFPVTVTGDTVAVVSSTPVQGVQAIASQEANGQRAIAIVNRSELPRVVQVVHGGWSPNGNSVQMNLVTATGLQTSTIAYPDFASGFAMPADSVAVFSIT